MHLINNKKFKYGYSLDDKISDIVSPPDLGRIVLTRQNPKFFFYGTRSEILEWMEKNKNIIVEYDPNNSSIPCSNTSYRLTKPLPPIINPLPTTQPQQPVSSLSKDDDDVNDNNSPVNSPKITIKPTGDATTITFNLYGVISDELVTFKPLNFAMNYITCLEMLLEISPTDLLEKDHHHKKYLPIKSTVLPSGTNLLDISKELEKNWKQTHLNSICIPTIKKPKSSNNLKDDASSSNGTDVTISHDDGILCGGEENEKRRNSFSNFGEFIKDNNNNIFDWISTRSTFSTTFKSKEASSTISSLKSTPIPPGILTPYIIDEMLNEIEDKRTLISKLDEANSEKNNDYHHNDANLPLYEHSRNDILLERGSTIKRNNNSN